jgi:hypothetical protein
LLLLLLLPLLLLMLNLRQLDHAHTAAAEHISLLL